MAGLAGVSRATIGSIVQGLLDDGVLAELEAPTPGTVGKPARPLWFRAGSGSAVCVEVRPRSVRAAVLDARGEMSAPVTAMLRDRRSEIDVLRATREVVEDVIAAATVRLLGIGISVPGTCDVETGAVVGSGQVPGAIGTGLVSQLASSDLPTYIENDSRAQAVAEQWFGAGRGRREFTSVQTGDGLGVGLVLDGAVHRGRGGAAGELGHTTVVLDGPVCRCGLRGCWETIATLRWLRAEARTAGLPAAARLDCRRLSVLADAGDGRAEVLLETYADHLAVGLANLTQLLAPAHVILHGDAVGGGEPFRRRIQRCTDRRTPATTDISFSTLGDRAALLGAGAVVLAERLHV
jgi:predicted NBD/HSP70 family sugar kinase